MVSEVRPTAFVPSADLDRARAFYQDILGLTIVSQDDFAVVAQSGDVTIRITNVGSSYHVQPFTVLGWQVDDLRAELAELRSRGVEFLDVSGIDQDDAGVWTAPGGAEVAWFKDPDGNTLSLDRQP